jgi:hypothetical protein
MESRAAAATCTLCGKTETQAHINTTCSHPTLMDLRFLHRKQIDLFLLALRCTSLFPKHQWIRPTKPTSGKTLKLREISEIADGPSKYLPQSLVTRVLQFLNFSFWRLLPWSPLSNQITPSKIATRTVLYPPPLTRYSLFSPTRAHVVFPQSKRTKSAWTQTQETPLLQTFGDP